MSKSTIAETYRDLRESRYANTSLSRLRQIAKGYSRKYKVPIRVSAKAFRDEDWTGGTDALLVPLKGGGYVIYLHPIMLYFEEDEIKRSIEHELQHLVIERKEYKRSRGVVEVMGELKKEVR